MADGKKEIWVFADYRNYFRSRVTLQLLAKSCDLAKQMDAQVCAVLIGYDLEEFAWEYTCHGASRVYIIDHPSLEKYNIDTYAFLLEKLAREYEPEIILVGATTFGREFAPRVAKRLKTGLSADCVGLSINEEMQLVQTAPFYGGNLLADIVTPDRRPQMASVRPGIFKELPHDNSLESEKVRIPLPSDIPEERVKMVSIKRHMKPAEKLETARVVVCGGRGMGSKKKFRQLNALADLLGAEIGATRPAVYADWADHDALVGQAGKSLKPQLLFSFGISGAIQHTAAITNSEFIIAVNKNPNAAIMKMADVAIVADASQFRSALVSELKKRLAR